MTSPMPAAAFISVGTHTNASSHTLKAGACDLLPFAGELGKRQHCAMISTFLATERRRVKDEVIFSWKSIA